MIHNYIKWGFESRLKPIAIFKSSAGYYIKWGFESRLKLAVIPALAFSIISNGDLRVD
uniref:hypothetical protein n=1 Tax=Aliarcobacter butzleri TaxID=28197 RepID=UPI00396A2FE3